MAVGLGADVTILDVNQNQLAYLDDVKPQVLPTFATVVANIHATEAPRVRPAASGPASDASSLPPGKAICPACAGK